MENHLKNKLNNNEPLIGLWSIIPSPMMAEVIGLAGLDFQIFDMEHGVYDLNALDASIRACESSGCSPIVRVPEINQSTIQSVMDLGAYGIVVPQIIDKSSVERIIRYMRYAPEGVRGYNPFTRAALYSNPSTNKFGKLNNSFGFSSIIIENQSSYEAIDEILSVEELDMVYLGVYDMSVALGCEGDVNHPVVLDFVEKSVKKIRDAGKAAGMMVKNEADIQQAKSIGANVLVYGVDTFIINRAIKEAINQVKVHFNN
ncbi:2-keto-3-deoxy-L-rhamnonate aldolase [compost metagenome]